MTQALYAHMTNKRKKKPRGRASLRKETLKKRKEARF
jgi:hypothetical protein